MKFVFVKQKQFHYLNITQMLVLEDDTDLSWLYVHVIVLILTLNCCGNDQLVRLNLIYGLCSKC